MEISDLDFTKNIELLFAENSVTETFKKGEYLISRGQIENQLYYIEDGAVKVFFVTENSEHIIRLGYKGSFINSISSFFRNEPSNLYIEAIRKTKVKSISRENLLDLMYKDTNSLMSYTKFLESVIVQQIEREIDLHIDMPAERLKRVMERSPGLFQHVPLKYIAAYLRMKPETLSRILKS